MTSNPADEEKGARPPPEQKFQSPHLLLDTEAMLALSQACGENRTLFEALLRWISLREGLFATKAELDVLGKRLQELEIKIQQHEKRHISCDKFASLVRAEVRNELKWWGSIIFTVVTTVVTAVAGLVWFFWENIHPLLSAGG